MPIMVTQMIETGEESGALDDMLDKSRRSTNEVSTTVDSLTSVLEPLIIVFIGACIGCIVVEPVPPDVRLRQTATAAEGLDCRLRGEPT